MGAKFGHGVMILFVISAWSRFGNHAQNKTQQPPRQILVGGSEHWHYGFNYTDWAFKNAPFYLNDTLGEFSSKT